MINIFKSKRKRAKKTKSPIERIFFDEAKKQNLKLKPQHKIDRFFVDFIVVNTNIVIELDGYSWHNTFQQRQNDYRRERFLISKGWIVIRFTGSEVYRDKSNCVKEIKDILKGLP